MHFFSKIKVGAATQEQTLFELSRRFENGKKHFICDAKRVIEKCFEFDSWILLILSMSFGAELIWIRKRCFSCRSRNKPKGKIQNNFWDFAKNTIVCLLFVRRHLFVVEGTLKNRNVPKMRKKIINIFFHEKRYYHLKDNL